MIASELMAVTKAKPGFRDWQQAIDAGRWLVPLVLDRVQPQAERGIWSAQLGGERTLFELRDLQIGLLKGRGNELAGYRYAFSIPGGGALKPCAAGVIALWAHVLYGVGDFFEPVEGITFPIPDLPKFVNALLATAFDKTADHLTRYPEDRMPQSGQPYIQARIA